MADRDELTVVLFKDHLASRTFRVPLRWISGLGLALGCAMLLTVSLGLIAGKYYLAFRQASPALVGELEKKVSELQSTLDAIRSPPPSLNAEEPDPLTAPTAKLPTATATIPTLLPSVIQPVPEGFVPRIHIEGLATSWKRNSLVVRFNISYTRNDGGNQQGRIMILARGAKTILTHPKGVMNLAAEAPLLSPEKGEYFSVSRFRMTEAEFEPVAAREELQSVTILIFDQDFRLLIRNDLDLHSEKQGP